MNLTAPVLAWLRWRRLVRCRSHCNTWFCWPLLIANVRIVPQATVYVIERLGAYAGTADRVM